MENMESKTTGWTTLDSWRARRVEVFGKWLWIYFWMQIIPLITAVIVVACEINETPVLFEELLDYFFGGAAIWSLYKLGTQEERFKTCAGLSLILMVAGAVIQLLNSKVVDNLWTIPGAILEMVVAYQFMIGCAEILETTDTELSENWRKLWKWEIGLLIGSIIGFPVLVFLAAVVKNILVVVLTSILALGFAIAVIAVVILQLVYLYRTVRLFRSMAAAMNFSGDRMVRDMG